MRVIALLATYNEERFIAACLEHLIQQGVDVYLIDNCSTDRTLAIAEAYLHRGLIGVESFPRAGVYSWRPILERKEQLAGELEGDWFMHVDADEIRVAWRSQYTLKEALEVVEAQGFNAVNFLEFTFIPTEEEPDHDHPGFLTTMRWYYPFLPMFPHRLNAWKRMAARPELAWSGGHHVRFPGLRMFPESFRMRHYLFLSVPHAIEKYAARAYDSAEVRMGWHGWRVSIEPERIKLPSQSQLRRYVTDDELNASMPHSKHWLAAWNQ